MNTQRVVLVGMMGAGKSTIGASLSKLTGWPYIDNDQIVEQMAGVPTRDLLQQRGVDAMRAAESAAALQVLTMKAPLIAGVAAGIVLDPTVTAQVHEGAFVVFLRAHIDTLAKRVEGTYRPWLGDDPEAALRTLYVGREPLYEKLAHLVIDVDTTTPDDVARRILDALQAAQTSPAQ
ncbi:MAG TPA: shikimate kinase [Acidothermaceae bacterium]|jgi:shikimate kinase|nr:shikimate kinase [Acidothermaceae bacterium]